VGASNEPEASHEPEASTSESEYAGRDERSPVPDELSDETISRELASAETFLRNLLDAFGVAGRIETVRNDDDSREVRVTGEDLGLLVGPKGATIEAVQELTRLAARRDTPGRSELRLRVDIGGYRERRRAALVRFAQQLADDVRASGVPKVLEPMSSPDRKVVHDALTGVEGVSTLSEGEEPRRRVVIVPQV
jgi:spoIIIJ-associated protein